MKDRYSIYVKRAACLAIFTAFFLVSIKAIAWWKTGSVSILAAITDSLLDLLASFTNMLILRFALMPADDNHSFGHGKAESLASLAQGMFICGSVVFLFLQGIQRLHSPEITDHNIWGIAVTIVSVIMTAILVSFQKYTIKRTDSPAIKADSLHYQTDLFMNLGILIALVISYYGFVMADAICALIIAVFNQCLKNGSGISANVIGCGVAGRGDCRDQKNCATTSESIGRSRYKNTPCRSGAFYSVAFRVRRSSAIDGGTRYY